MAVGLGKVGLEEVPPQRGAEALRGFALFEHTAGETRSMASFRTSMFSASPRAAARVLGVVASVLCLSLSACGDDALVFGGTTGALDPVTTLPTVTTGNNPSGFPGVGGGASNGSPTGVEKAPVACDQLPGTDVCSLCLKDSCCDALRACYEHEGCACYARCNLNAAGGISSPEAILCIIQQGCAPASIPLLGDVLACGRRCAATGSCKVESFPDPQPNPGTTSGGSETTSEAATTSSVDTTSTAEETTSTTQETTSTTEETTSTTEETTSTTQDTTEGTTSTTQETTSAVTTSESTTQETTTQETTSAATTAPETTSVEETSSTAATTQEETTAPEGTSTPETTSEASTTQETTSEVTPSEESTTQETTAAETTSAQETSAPAEETSTSAETTTTEEAPTDAESIRRLLQRLLREG